MKQSEEISQYLKTVCEQIRWKKAHESVSKEIENHILDQVDAFVQNGMEKEEATLKAIQKMGDPALVGTELDRVHKPKIEWGLIIWIMCILLIGFSARGFMENQNDMLITLASNVCGVIVGAGCMIAAIFLDFTVMGKYPKTFSVLYIAILIGSAILSPRVNGRLFYVQLIPLLFPAVFAAFIYHVRLKRYRGVILSEIFLAVAACIGLIFSTVSSVFASVLIGLVLLTFAILKGWFGVRKTTGLFLIHVPVAMMALWMFMLRAPYLWHRILAAINPVFDLRGAGYMGDMVRKVLVGAKWIGSEDWKLGIGNYLPDLHTNFILTYCIYQFGWISFVAIMIVLIAFMGYVFMLCRRQKSILGKLVSIAIWMTLAAEIIGYVLFNLGFLLLSPLSLPLISYGTIATIINMTLLGILLSVLKTGTLTVCSENHCHYEANSWIEIEDGKIIIQLKRKNKMTLSKQQK